MPTVQSAPLPSPSARVRTAEVAAQAALAVTGVVRLDAGPLGQFLTAGGGVRVPGVSAAVAPEGGTDLHLRIVAGFVPLHPLADAVRVAVIRAASALGLVAASVAIDVVDVELPGGGA